MCAVEIDAYCREILLRRQEEGHLEPFPIWDDARTFDGTEWAGGAVDLVSAGFPCQPFSVAGKREGADDERNLWPDTARILGEVRPAWCLLENVPALASCGYLARVVEDLAALGYVGRYGLLSAAAVGAPHRRQRLWIVAHAIGAEPWHEPGRRSGARGEGAAVARDDGVGGDVADAASARLDGANECESAQPNGARSGWWSTEPDVGRVADGVAARVDRLRAIGNGQVPSVVRRVWELMTQEAT